MQIPKLAIENYQFTLVVFIIVTLFGIGSYLNMPKSEDPYTEYHTTTILVVNPGSTPEDMETLVVDPLEEGINELDGIKNIATSIEDGVAFFFVEYLINEDYDKKHQEILQKINEKRGELPSTIAKLEILQPSVLNVSIYQLAFVSKGAKPQEVKQEAENLKKRLEKVSGIRKVKLKAEQDLEVQISLDMERLAAYNLTLGRIIQIIQSENMSIPGGSVDLGNKKFNIQTSGLYKDLNEIRNTVVNAGMSGIVRLSDVATVEFDYKKSDVASSGFAASV